jgi:hypothetical protein
MPVGDISKLATCTTCSFDQDLSNYWTANLFFKARNGTYKRVPQIANQGNNGDVGGMTVYYTSPGSKATTAFKPVSSPTPRRACLGRGHLAKLHRDSECLRAIP